MTELHVSPAGRAMIEGFEGCRLHAYEDIVGVVTIGYGCTGSNIHMGMTITQAQADQMLTDRLAKEFEPGVRAAVGAAPTTQGQFDAMVSLAFNIGIGGFSRSTVCRMHKAGKYSYASDAFMLWIRAGGQIVNALAKRRRVESDLYWDDSPDDT